jgi:hypothetical protein
MFPSLRIVHFRLSANNARFVAEAAGILLDLDGHLPHHPRSMYYIIRTTIIHGIVLYFLDNFVPK